MNKEIINNEANKVPDMKAILDAAIAGEATDASRKASEEIEKLQEKSDRVRAQYAK